MGKNEPRHKVKQDGYLTHQWCFDCHCHQCNPMFEPLIPTPSMRKRDKRRENKECLGCGKKICKCKNRKGY
jgi:hypothetical protein